MGCSASSTNPLVKIPLSNGHFFRHQNGIGMGSPEKELLKKAHSSAAVAMDDYSLVVLTSPSTIVIMTTLAKCELYAKSLENIDWRQKIKTVPKAESSKHQNVRRFRKSCVHPCKELSANENIAENRAKKFISENTEECETGYFDLTKSNMSRLPKINSQNRGNYSKSQQHYVTSLTAVEETSETSFQRDRAKIGTPPPEKGDFELPQTKFIDGNLGITDEETVRQLEEGLAPGELYLDDEFPANETSLYFMNNSEQDVEWKRPHELVENPQLFVKGINRRDVIQGVLGNCWFLSSCSAVARTPKLIERVIPRDQKLVGAEYKGFIICHFWRFGSWITVCIDDLLPTKNGKLFYAKSEDDNEFWVALLEKAYAKIHGSYQALEGGQSMNAMVDLTGGLAERFDMEETADKKKLFRYLSRASKNGAFITASIRGDWRSATKANEKGLVEGHAYTVSGVTTVNHKSKGKVYLIRIRNPWANDAEWNGAWSDGDMMWDDVPAQQRLKLLQDDRDDGEFWMSFSDFCKEFEEVSMCRMGPDYDENGTTDVVQQVRAIKGEWIKGVNAGGSRNNFKKFAINPQFLLKLSDTLAEEDDDELSYVENESTIPVLIGLMQEHRQSSREESVKMLQIGFCVYKNHNPTKRISLSNFLHAYDEGTSGTYVNYREVICRLEIRPGNYVIIPATFEPGLESEFMIRVYCPQNFQLEELYSDM